MLAPAASWHSHHMANNRPARPQRHKALKEERNNLDTLEVLCSRFGVVESVIYDDLRACKIPTSALGGKQRGGAAGTGSSAIVESARVVEAARAGPAPPAATLPDITSEEVVAHIQYCTSASKHLIDGAETIATLAHPRYVCHTFGDCYLEDEENYRDYLYEIGDQEEIVNRMRATAATGSVTAEMAMKRMQQLLAHLGGPLSDAEWKTSKKKIKEWQEHRSEYRSDW